MRKIALIFLIFVFSAALAYGEENKEKEITLRPGMELKKIGGINMIVPEGTEIYEENGQFRVEGVEEYAARRFRKTEERMAELEENQRELKEEIRKLKEGVEELQDMIPDEEKKTGNY